MASLHDQKYKKWDKIAKEELDNHEAEEEKEKEEARKALGLDAPMSKDEKEERQKHAQVGTIEHF